MPIFHRFPRSVMLFALALACLTSLPFVVGAITAPEGFTYSGSLAVPPGAQWDYNSHLARLHQGAQGRWTYDLLFTHEEHTRLPLVHVSYLMVGQLARFIPVSLPLLYHVIRFILTVILVLALWTFAAHFFETLRERWLGVLMATLVSGWSWLLLVLAPDMTRQVSPIEFWLSDAYNLFGVLYAPHFTAAMIVQIAVLLIFTGWVQEPRAGRLVLLALVLAAEAILQPYSVLLFGTLLGLLALVHLRVSRRLSWQNAASLTLPLGVYGALSLAQYVMIARDPVWSNFASQNQTRSPAVIYYFLGYLPLLIPTVALFLSPQRRDERWILPLLWVGLVALLVYAPLPTQRRYLLGVQTPLAVLAAAGWSGAILPRLNVRQRGPATIVYLAFAAIGSLLILLANSVGMTRPDQRDRLYYSPDERAAYAWLRDHAEEHALIFTAADEEHFGSGGKVVAATGRRVFIGHWMETAHFEDKVRQVEMFYDPATSDGWRRDLLARIGADYVWYDSFAARLGDWRPTRADYLMLVFVSGDVMIFEVTP